MAEAAALPSRSGGRLWSHSSCWLCTRAMVAPPLPHASQRKHCNAAGLISGPPAVPCVRRAWSPHNIQMRNGLASYRTRRVKASHSPQRVVCQVHVLGVDHMARQQDLGAFHLAGVWIKDILQAKGGGGGGVWFLRACHSAKHGLSPVLVAAYRDSHGLNDWPAWMVLPSDSNFGPRQTNCFSV